MKKTIVAVLSLALIASLGIKVTSTSVESDAELDAVDQNIESFAEAASLASFCDRQLNAAGHAESAKVAKESFDRLHLAARIIPERKNSERQSNASLFDHLVKVQEGKRGQHELTRLFRTV